MIATEPVPDPQRGGRWPDTLFRHIDEACDRFEKAWRAGDAPRIEEYLESFAAPERPEALRDLVTLEWALRHWRGERPDPQEYHRRFPEYRDQLDLTQFQSDIKAVDSPAPANPPSPGPATREASQVTLTTPGPVQGGNDGMLASGARVANYEVVAKLGHGGMGEVYRVRHVFLKHERALKIIASRHISPVALHRFKREMEAAGRTNHPNVILATDAGESQGLHYLVMELVPGTDLAALVQRRGPLPVADACELIRQAALGLQAIHEAGLVHRDIKPQNLMLTPDGLVKVLDLGLARLIGEDGDTLTAHGSLAGTADYMAPEQAVDLRSVTIAADLYSLGCTLYCLLAGYPPFGDGRYPSFTSKLSAHRDQPVPPLDALRPELAQQPGLLRLLDRLLAKDPAARPSEPRTVAEALGPLALGHNLPKLFSQGLETQVRQKGSPPPGRPPAGTLRAAAARLAASVGLVLRLSFGKRRVQLRIVLTVVVASLALMAMLFPTISLRVRHPGSAPPLPPSVPIKEAAPLRIESLDVEVFRGDPPALQGTIGVLSRAVRFDDNVRVRARLSAPGYCYLIALNPDGSVQLCPKAQENTPPSVQSEIVYPADPEGYYGLTEGTGLHAFVVVASRKPLPAFDSWPARTGLPWNSTSSGGAWRFDGQHFVYLGSPDRSERRIPATAPAPFADVCRYLSELPEVHMVQAMAFPVLPAEGSKTAPIPAP
jgi:serine/threonine protein kinase